MSSNPNALIGNGAYFFPSISVYGDDTEKTIWKPLGYCERKVIVNKKLDDKIRVLVTDDGFICPIIDKSENLVEFLNIIFATFSTKIFGVRYITHEDLASFGWEEGTDKAEVNRARSLHSFRNNFEFQRNTDHGFNEWTMMHRQSVSSKMIEETLDSAYKFYRDPEFKDDLLLIGESWGLNHGEMHTASFLYSWMIIEGFLEKLWVDYVNSLSRTKDEKNSLKNHHSWSVSHYIEVFHFTGQMNPTAYQSLTVLRKIRNAVIHDKRKINQQEAWECLYIAIQLLYNKLNKKNPFYDLSLSPFMYPKKLP